LNQSKSGADQIRGAEGMESLENTKKRRGESQIAFSAGKRRVGKKRVQVHSLGPIKGIYTHGHWTCPVKGSDLFNENRIFKLITCSRKTYYI
jgi:hypothetical protein